MKKKILKWIGIVLFAIMLAFIGMMAYVSTHPTTDCDSCLNGTTP